MPALLAAVHSLRELLFGHMPALGAALAGFEFAGWSVHPFATSFQHFVAKKRSEQPRGGVQYFPVQARLLGNLFSRFFHSAYGAAGHVLEREFFRRHQGIAAGQEGRLLVRPVQTLAGYLGAGSTQPAHSLFSAIGAPVALARNCLLQPNGLLLLLLPPARVVDVLQLASVRYARQESLHAPVIGQCAIGLPGAFWAGHGHGQRQIPASISVQDVGRPNLATLAGLASGANLAHARQAQATVLPIVLGREAPTVTMAFEAEAGKTPQRFEAGKARRFACLDPAKERAKGLVQAAQRHLLAGAVGSVGPLGQVTAQNGKALALVGIGNRFARLAPGADAFFQGCVVELLVCALEVGQRNRLFRRWVQPIGCFAQVACFTHDWLLYIHHAIKQATSLRLRT